MLQGVGSRTEAGVWHRQMSDETDIRQHMMPDLSNTTGMHHVCPSELIVTSERHRIFPSAQMSRRPCWKRRAHSYHFESGTSRRYGQLLRHSLTLEKASQPGHHKREQDSTYSLYEAFREGALRSQSGNAIDLTIAALPCPAPITIGHPASSAIEPSSIEYRPLHYYTYTAYTSSTAISTAPKARHSACQLCTASVS